MANQNLGWESRSAAALSCAISIFFPLWCNGAVWPRGQLTSGCLNLPYQKRSPASKMRFGFVFSIGAHEVSSPRIYARALLKHGHVVFDELRQGIREIEFLADPTIGEVRIGCPESMTAAFVPAIIDQLSRQYPHVVVHVVNAQTAEQEFRELRERSVDLMVGRSAQARLGR